MLTTAASKVPPPKSNTIQYARSSASSNPYANAAAVGSCTSGQAVVNPASRAASVVALFWFSVNAAGTVITAASGGVPV